MIIIIMGVSGSGKTTIGIELSKKLGFSFLEGDDFHPPENIIKMKNGVALTDQDRMPWLKMIVSKCEHEIKIGNDLVIACSALKKSYRLILNNGFEHRFIHLKGNITTIKNRMLGRDHFMPIQLIDSQFATLETPSKDENSISIDIKLPVNNQIEEIVSQLNLTRPVY
ncbi:gluconokinase [Rhodospirillaceae bacterium]|jgi:gluconokinase|nr:gluconokinase [Alphaproteobacteria bacterium]MDC1442655.1 gluconokinase [Rhodospirillaceae bacterium]